MASLCVLVTSCTEPDQEFSSVMTLARHVVATRDRTPGRPAPALYHATVAGIPLPSGKAVAIRLDDGSCNGKGAFVGYAFIPGQDALARLRQALTDCGAAMAQIGAVA